MNYRTRDGKPTTADDPERLLWYGICTYWTDDWDKVRAEGGGIPHCPHCRGVGFETQAEPWFNGANRFERDGHLRYVEFLLQSKETCRGKQHFGNWYEEWLAAQPG